MPYDSSEELPASIKKNLPAHAQEIFRKAFNNAWEQYKDPKERRGNASREQVARKVAWSAVKQQYEKNPQTGKWERK